MGAYAYIRKQFVPLDEARVSVVTHALNYGTAAFEGIRGNWNEEQEQMYLFRVPEHYERLLRACRIMKIDLPYTVDDLCQITLDLMQRNDFREDVYVRPLAYKSSEAIGVRIHDLEADFALFAVPFGNYIDTESGISCGVSSWRRPGDNMVPAQVKITGLYVNSAMAKTEANENGFDEAVLLTDDGHVSEGSGENIFLVEKGVLVTPPTTDSIIVGITRDAIIKLAKDELGINTEERRVDRTELYTADEFFMTGTAAHVSPVTSVDRRPVGNGKIGPVTRALQSIYFDVIKGRRKDYLYWCTPVARKLVTAS